jgi:hypothetical protein
MKKTIFYQIHKCANKTHGCQNNDFSFPFFKKGGGINGHRAYFNEQVECYVMNDKNRQNTGHGGIFYSKVPYSFLSLNELISYNDYISENVSFKIKVKRFLNKIGFSFKSQNALKSKIEYTFGLFF